MMHSQAASPTRTRDLLITLGIVGVVVVGILGMAAATGWEETWASLSRITMGWQ